MATQADISNNNLLPSGATVLVQNELGIFYGSLTKFDTRNGTALIENGFMISPDRHITFLQYLNFLYGELEDAVIDIMDDLTSDDKNYEDIFDTENSIIPNEISISEAQFSEHVRRLSITDYAAEGIAQIQIRTSSYYNTSQYQATSSVISLTGVKAIVGLDPNAHVVHRGLLQLSNDGYAGALIERIFDTNDLQFSVVETFAELISAYPGEPKLAGVTALFPNIVVSTARRSDQLELLESGNE